VSKHALSPKDLDKQSEISIHRWVEIGSEEHRLLDDDPVFTNKILRMGLRDSPNEAAFLCYDSNGRIWSANPNDNGKYYPFHFESGSRCYGYRNSKFASN
jgi:hypothetical protein